MNLMVGELNASHLGVGGAPQPGLQPTPIGKLGLRFDRAEYENAGRLKITEIITLSPAEVVGGIRIGDYLVSVDGVPVQQGTNLDELLENKVGKRVPTAEVLSAATRRRIVEAWGTEPFDQYVTTEAGPIAGECPAHGGMHVLTDHVILEVEDARVLVTVLSSRTIPLLRYELADRVVLASDECPCGRPGPRIEAVLGRARDVLRIGGAVVHPTAVTAVLDTAAVAGWQVVQTGDHLQVLVVGPGAGFDGAALEAAVAAAVPGAVVDVEVVDALPHDAAGKAERFVSGGGR